MCVYIYKTVGYFVLTSHTREFQARLLIRGEYTGDDAFNWTCRARPPYILYNSTTHAHAHVMSEKKILRLPVRQTIAMIYTHIRAILPIELLSLDPPPLYIFLFLPPWFYNTVIALPLRKSNISFLLTSSYTYILLL